MPDYKELGRALLRVAHGERIDESMDVFYAQDIELQIDSGELLRDSGAFDIVGLSLSVLGKYICFLWDNGWVLTSFLQKMMTLSPLR